MPSRRVFPFLSLLFFNALSSAQAMMEDAITTEKPTLPSRKSSPSTPTFFPEDGGVEIDYAYIQPTSLETRDNNFSRMLHENLIGKHKIRLKNVPFNGEMAAQLSYILDKENLKPKHLDLVCCTVQDCTTLYNFDFKNLKKLDVRVVIGEPLKLRDLNAYAYAYPEEKKSLENGSKALADALTQIPGLSVRKSSARETVTIDFRALKVEDVTQDPSVPFLTALAQIEDGTKNVTIKNTPFTNERAYALLYHLQRVRALDKPTTPSVEKLDFEGCSLEDYSALAAFRNAPRQWAALNLIVTFSEDPSATPNVDLPSATLPSILRPTTQDWYSFFENLGDSGRREASRL